MSAAVPLPLKRFTREETHRMMDAGAFEGRFELLDGYIVDKTGQNPLHASTIHRLFVRLVSLFAVVLVRVRMPIDVAESDRVRNEPEPDIAVLAQESPDYGSRHPRGDELQLLIEVADTTLGADRTLKRDLYARAGVPEYWIVDLTGRRTIVHRNPAEGAYGQVTVLSERELAVCWNSFANHARNLTRLLPVPGGIHP
jgi:Uma2 family endonuclease